jgi:mycoredoxin-dependent peroxiredoxin
VVPEVGTEAPDFTLKNQDGEDVTLSSFRGDRNVLVVFYPFAFSKTCTGELSTIRDDLSNFQNSDVQILAVSTDPADALKSWSQAEGYDFPLLSDFWPHGKVAQAYGVFDNAAGMALRGTFLIDKSGVVCFVEVTV